MPTDPYLLERLDLFLNSKKVPWQRKNMFGGVCYMVNNKMCFGPYQNGLMLRLDPHDMAEHIKKKGASQMVHGGRHMNGYIHLEPEGFDLDEDLETWLNACLAFNPKAKASKSKKKKPKQ